MRRAFDPELRDGHIQSIEIDHGCSILAVVGDGMAGAHGVAAKVFTALGSAGVNVRAIAQGASERNISVVIDGRGSARALRAVHSSFYLSAHTVSIGLIGPGLVGGSLLEQIASQAVRLERDFKLDLRIRAIAGSKTMRLAAGCDRPSPLARRVRCRRRSGGPRQVRRPRARRSFPARRDHRLLGQRRSGAGTMRTGCRKASTS